MAGQIQSCDSTTYPARSPGDIRGRRHSVALQGGDFEGEERIFPSSCLGTHNLQYFYFLVSFHLYVHAYVNLIGTIFFFSFVGEKYTSPLGDAKQQGGRHANQYLTQKVTVITKGGDRPRKMRTPPAQSLFHP